MTNDESNMSQRDRRRRDHEASKPKVQLPKANLKQWAGPLVLVLLIGGITTAMVVTSVTADECPGHWHSTFNVYVDDEQISYKHGAYNLQGGQTPMSYHLHQPNDATIHFEPPRTECVPMGDFLSAVDTAITDTSITFNGYHAELGQDGTYTSEGDRTLTIYIQPDGEEWQTIGANEFNKRQSPNGERILILFGDYTDARIAQLQSAVPVPPAQ